MVPLINRASFERMRVHMNPVDEKSMNGNYPGKPTGTQTERALDLIAREVIQKADVVVDLHNGDIDENLRPYSIGRGREAPRSTRRVWSSPRLLALTTS